MSAWQEYKKKLGTTRPWDVLMEEPVSVEISNKRMLICEECPELIPVTKQCKQCGCFMKMKVRLEKASCPIGKW